jgi:glycerol-3-phosphate O-acyltransferase
VTRAAPSALLPELQQIALASMRPLEEICANAARDAAELDSRRGKIGSWLFARLSQFVRQRGYKQPAIFDHAELDRVRRAMGNSSVVFLVTHKTYLDFFVLYEFFYRHGMTPPRIFGGANMAFAGFGALARRAGGIFIRRSFRDDPVYKAVLDQRITDLLAAGESFMWAIEGTRSRTGKLLIPKLGLLNYVTRAARPMGNDIVSFVPVAVVYDRIPDVADMAAQEAGARKQRESLAWFFDYLGKLRGQMGDIHVRFAAPLALGETPDAPELEAQTGDNQESLVAVQKLAFEVCFRINEITPATLTSLVLLSLLCRGQCSVDELRQDVNHLLGFIRSLQPASREEQPSRAASESLSACIDALQGAGILQQVMAGAEQVFRVCPQALSQAVYYSNMAAHHLVIPAFTELALALLAQSPGDFSLPEFEARCLALRELFKFEFFFSRKATFLQQLRSELQRQGLRDPQTSQFSHEQVAECLRRQRMRIAVGVLAPYLPAYRAIVEFLEQCQESAAPEDEQVIRQCLEQAQQRELPGSHDDYSIFRPGLSRALLANGLRVADSRNLRTASDHADSKNRRQAFLAELDQIEAALQLLARMNQAG